MLRKIQLLLGHLLKNDAEILPSKQQRNTTFSQSIKQPNQSLNIAKTPNNNNEILLKELSKSDINWLFANGYQQQVISGAVLISQQRQVESLYIVMKGSFSASIKRNQQSTLASVFAALEDNDDLQQEIAHFSTGEVFGETSFLNISTSVITVKALENSVVLTLPSQKLLAKLQEDLDFASRFYRAIAIILWERFEYLVKQFVHRQHLQIRSLQDIPLIFGELSDSDVEWMIEHSQVEEFTKGTVLIQAGRSVENLYLLLQGSVSLFFKESKTNALSSVFASLENKDQSDEFPGYEIAQLIRGELIGEMALLDSRLPAYNFKALEDLRVLVIPRQLLSIKLLQNPSMGNRFYRVIAMLLLARLQALISRLIYDTSSYQIGQTLLQELGYENEINLETMDKISLGGARFDWMLRRLRILS
ncbi:cyclic nucleotide-binding domain-containing protein [Aerosakkonemataceae cyanobacterium BLCC-F50]|uniref:Cyclic nucleotide-binding domain-containing protein n=1 Tax=Floridaenema flaviceps BLCC-F50 TaxID=3153642 RepID=A0ABV4XL71_9CYAN